MFQSHLRPVTVNKNRSRTIPRNNTLHKNEPYINPYLLNYTGKSLCLPKAFSVKQLSLYLNHINISTQRTPNQPWGKLAWGPVLVSGSGYNGKFSHYRTPKSAKIVVSVGKRPQTVHRRISQPFLSNTMRPLQINTPSSTGILRQYNTVRDIKSSSSSRKQFLNNLVRLPTQSSITSSEPRLRAYLI